MAIALLVIFWLSLAVLAYAHFAYPAIMFAVSRTMRHRISKPSDAHPWPSVSLIIPAFNEELHIEAKLQNSNELDYPHNRLEIIVVSDGSTDSTVEKAARFADSRVRLFDLQPRNGKASALNSAVEQSTGSVLCLCDANVMFEPDALRQLITRLAGPQIGAVTGDVRLASDVAEFGVGEKLYYSIERGVQAGESIIGSVMGVDGGMYVLRRTLYRDLSPETILDDFVTTMRTVRQGARVVYEPAAVAFENGTALASQEFERRVRVTAGAIQSIWMGEFPSWRQPVALWQYFSHKLLRWFSPVWLIILFVSNLLLCPLHPGYLLFAVGQIAVCFSLLTASAVPPLRRTALGSIGFYLALSHAAMLVGMLKGLAGTQRVTWNRTERQHEVPATG